jgi:hypothetical protein
MSAPSLDPPKAATYTIHPNKQCGVVKEDGNPCSTRLGCRIHSEGEKLVVKRSRRHQKFLRKQLAFDPLRLAPVFDPDVHCGVDLSSGEPCTQDLLCCDTDTINEQAAVPGRCASLNSIIRVNKANASRPQWKSGDDPWQYDSDTDCGARTKNGGRCQGLLSCTLHKLRAKRSAPRKSSYDFNTLLQIQISRRALYGEDEPSRHDAAEKGQDGQVDHILGGSGEGQQTSGGEGSTGSDGIYAQGGIQDGPPATPGRPPRGHLDTAFSSQTPTAPSPKTPRGNASSLSLDTSDDEQFTPTSSKYSLYGGSSGGMNEDAVEGSKADLEAQEADVDAQEASLNAQEAQLQRDWAKHRQEQARGELHNAQLRVCRDWEQVCHDQARQHCLEIQLLQDQGKQDCQKAQLYDQDREHRVAAQLLWDRDQEYRRAMQLRYDQDRAELDRRVHDSKRLKMKSHIFAKEYSLRRMSRKR